MSFKYPYGLTHANTVLGRLLIYSTCSFCFLIKMVHTLTSKSATLLFSAVLLALTKQYLIWENRCDSMPPSFFELPI